MHLTVEQLAPIQALYDRGLFVSAHRAVAEHGLPPVTAWRGPTARVLAGRLTARIGAHRLANAIFDRARREAPDDARVAIYHLYGVANRRGTWAAWTRLRATRARVNLDADADPETASDFACLRAVLLATLRDFDGARAALAEASAIAPAHEWVAVQRSLVLEQEDRCDEALAASESVRSARPAYVPAATQSAHLLQVLGRDREALRLLQDTDALVEAFHLAAAVAALQEELGDDQAALAAVERALALAPMADKSVRQWGLARRCDLDLRLGRPQAARLHAEAVGGPFYGRLAERLAADGGDHERIALDVPFVRQHHMTCGPATLVALAQTFGRRPDHLQVADEICYGGTSAANARRWALRNDFVPREFTLGPEEARTLLRLGLPFAVATTEVTSGHLQAVLGFDALRDTWLVRDPATRHTREWMTREFLERYRASGPRALVLMPKDHPGTHLPPLRDEALYGDDFAIQEALVAHDHARALALYHDMLEREPEHPLTIQARWALSAYERDPVGTLACIERLLVLEPDDQRLLLRKVSCLLELDHTADAVATLEQLVGRRTCDPTFLVSLADELRRRAGGADRARALLRSALLRQPASARAHFTSGLLAWHGEDESEAGDSLRFSACLDETNDYYALTYCEWCRTHAASDTGLAFLRHRHERWLRRAGGPSVALYRALLRAHRPEEAIAALAEARAERPDDGELLLATAEEALRTGDLAGAEAALGAADGRAIETHRVAALADVAERAGDRARALRCWRSILAREPLNHRARVGVFQLLEVEQGRAEALRDLEAAASELPFARPLQRFYAHQLGRDDALAAERALLQIVEEDPGDAWAHRELALQLAAQGRLEEALARTETACELDAEAAAGHAIAGRVLARMGRHADAVAALRRAVARDVDEVAALADWWDMAADATSRRALCEHLVAAFSLSAGGGRGLDFFARAAASSQPAADVRAWLEAIAAAQPRARAASSALVAHMIRIDDIDAAQRVAEQACLTFALDPRVWLDRAAVAQRRRRGTEECAALERAAVLAPDSTEVAWHLASAYARHDRRVEARLVLETASTRGRDPNIETLLADLLVEEGSHDAALARVRLALRTDPEHHEAWRVLQRLGERLADPDLSTREARTLARARPHDATAHLMLAAALSTPDQQAERRATLERAIALDPSNPDAYDLLAELAAERGDFAAARAAIAAWPGPLPCSLRGRLAWLTQREGRTAAAIDEMRELLGEHPFYTFGWREMLEWLHDLERDDELAAAADAYAAHRPDDHVAYGWVGEASLRRGERAAAKAALQRALRLDPEYAFAASRLFQLHLEDGELDHAEANLALLSRAEQSARAALCAVQLACRRGEAARIQTCVRELCHRHGEDDGALRVAAEVVVAAGHATAGREALRAALGDAEGSGAGVFTVRTLTAAGRWRAARACVRDPRLSDAAFVGAASTLVDDLAESHRPGRVRSLLGGPTGARLRAADVTWAKAGYCLNAAGCVKATVRWMADWRQREGRQPWMLVNLAHALRSLGRHDEAHAVACDAVERPSEWRRAHAFHRHWLALDAYCAGDADAARAHLAHAESTADDRQTALATLVSELLAALSEPRPSARERTARALSVAFALGRKLHDAALQQAVRRVVPVTRRSLRVPSLLWSFLRG
ncbi:MAG: tetratricopeptide repeat protein [Planctomycetota bacterium]